MKIHVERLHTIAQQKERRIIGLMSGTSLDGLDVALCRFSGAGAGTRVSVEAFATVPYDDGFKAEIRQVFAKKTIDFQHLLFLNVIIAQRHADIVNQCLQEWKIPADSIDLLASHGQTVFHAPRVLHHLEQYPNATLQIGDGDHLARLTGIITVSDFRQKHVAAGGEGAPLALYGDYFLFSHPDATRFLLNIGGIANFTFLPPAGSERAAFATDTGPGNTLLDAFARKLFGVPFDADARLAGNGRVDGRLLERLKSDDFFTRQLPKTIGPELFSVDWVQTALEGMPRPNPYDLLATLTRLSAETIAEAMLSVNASGADIYLSGGGAHNPLLVANLRELLPTYNLQPMSRLGLDGDAKEAVLFAALANETVAGQLTAQSLGGVPLVGMGKISFPA